MQFLVLVIAYFLLQLITKSLVTQAVGIDEADQVVRGQTPSWGYGPQAPLYTWLMTFFLRTVGYSVFSLNLLRELMLFGIYALTYLNARALTRSHLCGIIAAAALQFHPTIVWESQRELTHSIAASLMVLAMLLAFVNLRRDRLAPWLLFGVFGGLATLSKYNAALVYAAILLSALTIPGLRQRVLDRRMALAIAITVLLLLPNALWILNHRVEASGSVYKLHIQDQAPWFLAVKAGLWVWAETLILHIAPVVAVFALLFAVPRVLARGEENGESKVQSPTTDARAELSATKTYSGLEVSPEKALSAEAGHWLWRVFLLLNLIVVVAVLAFKVTWFKDRWLQPLFIWLPLLLVLWAQPLLNPFRVNFLLGLSAAITIAMVAIIPGRLLFTESRGRRDVLNAPMKQFAGDLAGHVHDANCIVTDGYWLAGNLVLRFPNKPVYSLDLNPPPRDFTAKRCLLVWDATRRTNAPPALTAFASDFSPGKELSSASFLEHKWKYHRVKTMRVGIVMLER